MNSPNDCHHGSILALGNDCWVWWSYLAPWHTAYVCWRPALPTRSQAVNMALSSMWLSLKLHFIRKSVGVLCSIAEIPSMRPTKLVTNSAMFPSTIQQGKINSQGDLISLFVFPEILDKKHHLKFCDYNGRKHTMSLEIL